MTQWLRLIGLNLELEIQTRAPQWLVETQLLEVTCVSFSKELELGAATENRILEISLMWDVSVLTDVNYRANDLFLWPPHSTPLVVLLVYTLPLSIQQGSTWPQRQQELG